MKKHAFFLAAALLFPLTAPAHSLLEDAINRGEKADNAHPLARATVGLAIAMQMDGKIGAGICTGTLIARDLVLTAAHCLSSEGAEVKQVVAVVNTEKGRKQIEGGEFRVHSGFTGKHVRSFSTLWLIPQLIVLNDIALLKLKEPVDESAVIASLPEGALPEGRIFDLIPLGYGKPDGTAESQGGTLRIGASRGTIANASDGSAQFLAMHSGAMTCQGDSGGPIFLRDAGQPTVVGVTSHGDLACEHKSVATLVSHFLTWIQAAREELK